MAYGKYAFKRVLNSFIFIIILCQFVIFDDFHTKVNVVSGFFWFQAFKAHLVCQEEEHEWVFDHQLYVLIEQIVEISLSYHDIDLFFDFFCFISYRGLRELKKV